MTHTIILTVLLIVVLMYHLLYRKQINDFVKQLRFHKAEESNKEISAELKCKSIRNMQNELNILLEKQRNQRIAYEHREEKINQLVTDISHDIRTPLTSVTGYFQMMDESENEEERTHYKEIICHRLQTLSVMLDEFFTYAKLSQKCHDKPKEMCDVRQILCETLFLFYDEFHTRGIQVELKIPEERFLVYGNTEDFKRIFMNIMKNIRNHGCLEMRISIERKANDIRIVFENRTAEKLPQDLSEVFERFYKGDKARSNQESTGLGLCIVKELSEQMGGVVSAFSKDYGWFGMDLTFEGVMHEENTSYRR